MSDLMCSAVNCIYNISGLCSARNIHIGIKGISSKNEDTSCKNFLNKNFKNTVTSIINTNLIGEVKQVIDSENINMSPQINCDAKECIYNSGNMCSARHVQIYGLKCEDGQCTKCEVFTRK
jgi:hypothetical protein